MHSYSYDTATETLTLHGVHFAVALKLINSLADPQHSKKTKTDHNKVIEAAAEKEGAEVVQTSQGPVIVKDGQPDTEEGDALEVLQEESAAKILAKKRYNRERIIEASRVSPGLYRYELKDRFVYVGSSGKKIREERKEAAPEAETSAPKVEPSKPKPPEEVKASASPVEEPEAEHVEDTSDRDSSLPAAFYEAESFRAAIAALVSAGVPTTDIPGVCEREKANHKVLKVISSAVGERASRVLATMAGVQ